MKLGAKKLVYIGNGSTKPNFGFLGRGERLGEGSFWNDSITMFAATKRMNRQNLAAQRGKL